MVFIFHEKYFQIQYLMSSKNLLVTEKQAFILQNAQFTQ